MAHTVASAIPMRLPIQAGSEYPSRSGARISAFCMKMTDERSGRRYYAKTTNIEWPPEVHDYNRRFTQTLDAIKRRHDPTVTTVAQGVLEWKQNQGTQNIGLDVQSWLDRFYMSRIGIRFLIGQRRYINALRSYLSSHTPVVDVALNTLAPHKDYVGIICTRAVSDLPSRRQPQF